jgi:hypothetical protein
MDAFEKTRRMLEEANATFNEAEASGDAAAAAEIERTVIDPLKSGLAGLALAGLASHARHLERISAKLEQALAALRTRIDRVFVDRLIDAARELDLADIPASTGERTRPASDGTAAGDTGGATATRAGRAAVRSRPGTAAARRIDVSDRDVDALARVAHSEVGHFGKYGEAQLRGGLAAVVDTIFNRVAHDRFPDEIAAVVDQPKQFSAINDVGSWSALPAAPEGIFRLVADHVAERARGKASELDGATHFLNPFLSSESAMRQWGRSVVDNAVAVYGSEADEDVHYHGYAPGTQRPPPYVVARGGDASTFDVSGRSPGGPPARADIRDAMVRICREEHAYFDAGRAKETDDPQFRRVGDYWKAVGSPNHGRTVAANGRRPAWSAAFISYVMKTAGAGDRFSYVVAHCLYFQDFVDRPGPALFEAVPATDAAPQVGDIVHFGRGEAKHHDFAAARADFGDDGWYPSHGAVVVAVDREGGAIRTIGGNESNSVRETTFALDGHGRLQPRRVGSQNLPWIGLLRLS